MPPASDRKKISYHKPIVFFLVVLPQLDDKVHNDWDRVAISKPVGISIHFGY